MDLTSASGPWRDLTIFLGRHVPLELMGKVYITDTDIYSGGSGHARCFFPLTFHWNIMENQTSLSAHRTIKDKCVLQLTPGFPQYILRSLRRCSRLLQISCKFQTCCFFPTHRKVAGKRIDRGSGLDSNLQYMSGSTEGRTHARRHLHHKELRQSPAYVCVLHTITNTHFENKI